MDDQQDSRAQAAHLAEVVVAAQTIIEEYVAEKITTEEAMTALTKLLHAPALTEWMITNGFVSKQ